jgi:hypothetical protein
MQSRLTAFSKNGASPPKPKLDPGFDVCARTFGHYPWDDWHGWALAKGLDAELAGQGRLLIREAYNHGWQPWLQSLCGWGDDGQALLALALRSPRAARHQWDILMRTDGLRGDCRPRSTEWTWGYLRADAKRLAARLYQQAIVAALREAAREATAIGERL